MTWILLFSFVAFSFGYLIGKNNNGLDTRKRVAEIISCGDLEQDFLKEMGFPDRTACKDLHLALHKQYVDDCLRDVKLTGDKEFDTEMLDQCVYHKFEVIANSLSAEYYLYAKSRE